MFSAALLFEPQVHDCHSVLVLSFVILRPSIHRMRKVSSSQLRSPFARAFLSRQSSIPRRLCLQMISSRFVQRSFANSGGETEINKLPFMSQPSYTSSCLMLFVILRTYKRAFTLSLLTIVLTPVRHYAFSVASASCELRTLRISDAN